MRIAMIGAPGSECESIAELLADRLGVPLIAIRDLFEAEPAAGSALAATASRHMNAGELVPSHILTTMLAERLTRPDVAHGYVIDNFPVTGLEPPVLDDLLRERNAPWDRVVHPHVPDAEVLRRLSGRRMCRGCGRPWHVESAPTLKDGICDHCGGETRQREADHTELIAVRLGAYRRSAAPVLDYYDRLGILRVVDATLPVPRLLDEALT